MVKEQKNRFLAAYEKVTKRIDSRLASFCIFAIGIGYAAASVATTLISSQMVSRLVASEKGQGIVMQAGQVDVGKNPNFRDIRVAIMKRNVFNSEGEFPDESDDQSEDVEVKKTTADFDENAKCAKSKLNLTLVGTIYLEDRKISSAAVREAGYPEADVYKPGDEIIGQEGAFIVAVERTRVVINNNGTKECIEIENNMKGRAPYTPKETTAGGFSGGGPVIVEGSFVEAELGPGFAKIVESARFVPNTVNNAVNGFKIFAIKKGTLFDKIGLKNGDIVTQVNDISLTQPEQGFALYEAFENSREVNINVLRDGKDPDSIYVRIK